METLSITKVDGDSLIFDTVISVDYDPPVLITSNPIEDGSSVTDHSVKLPDVWTALVLMTGTPTPAQTQDSILTGLPVSGRARVQETEDYLRSCLGVPVFVTFRGRTARLFLAAMPYQLNSKQGIVFSITFQEAKIALQTTQTLPRLRVTKPNLKKDSKGDGDKPKPDTTPTQDAQAKAKVSASILERVRANGVQATLKSLGTNVLGVSGG